MTVTPATMLRYLAHPSAHGANSNRPAGFMKLRAMARGQLPRYKCEAIARLVTEQANLPIALLWTEVRDYYQPRLFDGDLVWLLRYDKHQRESIRKRLDREGRYLHVWTP
jgi:hypothetical protein